MESQTEGLHGGCCGCARACWTQYPPDGHLQLCVVAFATDEAPDFVHVRSPINLCVSAAIVARLDTSLDAARSNAMGQHAIPHACGEHGGGAPPQPDDAATQGRIKHYQEHRYPRSVTLCSSGNGVPNSGEPSRHGEQQTNRLSVQSSLVRSLSRECTHRWHLHRPSRGPWMRATTIPHFVDQV